MESGQIVISKNSLMTGILLEKSDMHPSFWKVLCEGKILEWHISNIDHKEQRDHKTNF